MAAFPVSGPLDVLTESVGAMREDLDTAIGEALTRKRADCLAYGRSFTWEASARQFLNALVPVQEFELAA